MKFNLPQLKRSLIAALLLMMAMISQSQSAFGQSRKFYSHTPEGLAYYELSDQKILVRFKPEVTPEQQSRIFGKLKGIKPISKDMILPSPKVTMAELQPGLSEAAINDILASLNAFNEVEYANPFLVYRDGTLQGIQDRFAVKLKSPSGLSKLQDMVRTTNCVIETKNEYDPLVYFIKVNKNSAGSALEMANQFAESHLFEYAEPDFLLLLKKFNTNDPLLPYQWALNNTGSSIQYNGTVGADMKIFSAWTMATGNASTKIAIIDEGVDLVHPDLVGNMLTGFDGTQQNSGGAPQGNDAHGTACAGIVAAVGNNNLGVAGIAYNSKIVPVRIAYSSGASWVTSNAWIGTSIDWAWNQGDADVLSNSWGGGSASSLINDPITRAVTQGRGGLGAVVLFAAGNDNSAVSYPATLTNVISVTAMSMCNQRKTPTSCDGESWWGSNFGVNGDISAPGVKIHTTDISGAAGYSTGDYAPTFNGTSSACPNAAGVMALILAINPSLNYSQARQIIESTCDKVGGYTYNSSVAGQPNGTWSNDLGYGRVNAFAALQLANPQPCQEPPVIANVNASPSSFCLAPSNIALSLSGTTFGTGQGYQWQSSTDNTTWTNISGANAMTYSASVSTSTYFRCLITCTSTTPSNSVFVQYTDPTISVYPHVQNFDGQAGLPCGWSTLNVNADGNTWVMTSSTARSAPNAVYYTYNINAAADDWLFSAPMVMQAGTNYDVRFWYRAQSATYPERMEVKWGSNPSAAGMSSPVIFSNSNIINTTYQEGITNVFSPAVTGVYYIGFHVYSLADMYNLLLDDVTIEVLPNCPQPNIGGTIAGPLSLNVGASGSYALSGFTGTNIQWQTATVSGGPYSDLVGQVTSTGIISFSQAGNYFIRAKVSSQFCIDAFSNELNVTVSCVSAIAGNASGPLTLSGGQSGSYSASGYTGDTFQWQNSIDGGVNFVNINGATTANAAFTLPIGTNQVRFVSRFGTCTPAFSNVLSVSVTSPVGNTFNNPINLSLPQSTVISTVSGSGFTSDYIGTGAQASPDVFFRLTTGPCMDSLVISTCVGTNFDTYLHFLNSAGTQIVENDDNGPSCSGLNASLKVSVLPNTVYYIVVEGYSTNTGTFNLQVTPIDNPIFQATITPAGSTIFCEGEGVQLQASAGTQYLWSTGETTSFIQALTTGVYTVTVTNANGCESQASISVEALSNILWLYDLDSDGFGDDNNGFLSCFGGLPGMTQIGGDCNDGNASIYPGANEVCNGIDDDCDLSIDEGFDVDGDGFTSCSGDCNDGNAAIYPGATEICNGVNDDCDLLIDEGFDNDGDGYTMCNGDCNDNNASIHSGVVEICNGVDDDCDLSIDEGFDVDGDGFTSCGGDCNDGNAAIYPGAIEICNGLNDDCDLLVDEGFDLDGDGFTSCSNDCNDNNAAVYPGATESCNGIDDDCDTVVDEGFDADGDGFSVCNGDCKDNNPNIYPGATEICNDKDDDCDGLTDEGFDLDGDGFTTCAGDCNDNNASVNPGATEICNGINDNCNSTIDEGFDIDGDGYTSCNGDCNDNNSAIHPGAADICGNGIDEDCVFGGLGDSPQFDPNFPTTIDWPCDVNISGIGVPALLGGCGNETIQYTDQFINGNCIGIIIRVWEAYRGVTQVASFQQIIHLTDIVAPIVSCPSNITANAVWLLNGAVVSYTVNATDNCSDVNVVSSHPSGSLFPVGTTTVTATATDVCGNFSTCSFTVTVNPIISIWYYQDLDGDGYGNPNVSIFTNDPPVGYVTNNLDCSDTNAEVHPGVIELCNGYDDDCDSIVDEGCCYLSATSIATDAPCQGINNGSVNLTVTNGSAPITYAWTNGATTEDISGLGAGTYSVVVTDAQGCIVLSSATVANLGGTPPPAATAINGPTGVCRNSVGNLFTVAPVPGATSYIWTLPNGATGASTTNSISLNFSNTYNTGNLCVRAVNACGAGPIFCRSVLVFTTIPTFPSNIVGQAINVCGGSTQTYSIPAVANAASYNWTVPSTATILSGQGTTSITIQLSAAFVSLGTVAVRSENCFGVSAYRTMTIYSIPGLPLAISGNANGVCSGSTQTYSIAAVSGATSYVWSVPAGAIINSGQGSTTINVTFPANYTSGVVSVRGQSSCGLGTARTLNVFSVPSISGVINGPASGLCGGNYTYSITAPVGALSYNWTLPAGVTMVTNNGTSVTVNIPTTFVSGNICVTATNACGVSVAKCLALIAKPATPTAPTGPSTTCIGQTGLVFTTPQVGTYSYTWTVPVGCSITAGQGTNTITVTWGSTSGSVMVKANNACGSSSTSAKVVAVVACMQTQNADENPNQKFDLELTELRIYPNPSDGHFVIQSNKGGAFAIYNELGQVVKSFSLNSDNMYSQEIDGLSTGFYFIKGLNENEGIIEKIVVTNK